MAIVSLTELKNLSQLALLKVGTESENAACVSKALVTAEADGLPSHGVSRVSFYADQVSVGKVKGIAKPLVVEKSNAICVDARHGFAYPAIAKGLEAGINLIRNHACVIVTISHSHHAGVMGHHVEQIASAGYLGLGFSNVPGAIAPWGGKKPTFGTNPLAFSCPRRNADPVVIDMSMSKVTKGKVMLAEKDSKPIPVGWALDCDGNPTTDAGQAMRGTMLPIADEKGAALAFMIEILTAGLCDADFAFSASSLFDSKGPPPNLAQTFVLFNPISFNKERFAERIETLFTAILNQQNVRLPGERRFKSRRRAQKNGVNIPDAIYQDLSRRASL